MTKIRLPRDGAEYAHFSFSSLPTGVTLQAQVGASAWTPLDTSAGVPRLLLRGPDCTSSDGVLVTTDSIIRVRIIDAPEVIVRGAGIVALVTAS